MSEAIRQPLLSSNSNSIQSKSVADDYDEPDPPKEEELDDGDEIGEHGHGHKGHKGIDHVCSEAKIAAAFVCQVTFLCSFFLMEKKKKKKCSLE